MGGCLVGPPGAVAFAYNNACKWFTHFREWGYKSYKPIHVFKLTVQVLIKGKSVFMRDTVCCRMSDVGFTNIDSRKEESHFFLTIRKIFVLSSFILELVFLVGLRRCILGIGVFFMVF
jgi:hypothetical protein